MNSDQLPDTSVTIGVGVRGCLEGSSNTLRSRSFTSFVVFPHGFIVHRIPRSACWAFILVI